jgi:hypothetical protein
MSQQTADALARIKKAIDGKPRIDEWQGRNHRCAYAEVNPQDVITVAQALPDLPLAVDLRKGCENAIDSARPVHTVHQKVVSLAALVEAADKIVLPPPNVVAPGTHSEPPPSADTAPGVASVTPPAPAPVASVTPPA